MAQFTTYRCDLCKKEWLSTDNSEQPVTIGIVTDFGNPTGKLTPKFAEVNQAMWCRSCVMRTGIFPPVTVKEKQDHKTQIPFEEKVAFLLEELGFQRI